MTRRRRQLPIPEWAEDNPGSYEVLRVWVVNGQAHCSALVSEGPFKDHKAWGRLLSEVAKQAAVEHAGEESLEPEDVFTDIVEAFCSETEHMILDSTCHFEEPEADDGE